MTPKRVLLLCVFGSGAFAFAGLGQAPPNAPPLPVTNAPTTFGTSNTVYTSVGEWKFTPFTSSWTYGDTGGNHPTRFMTVPNAFLLSAPELPSGALLQWIEFEYCNSNPTEQISLGFYLADFQNNITNTITSIVGPANSGCSHASFDISIYGLTVDNLNHRYPLYAFFGANGDSTTSIAGSIIGYKLQVSPAPGSNTFNDVLPSDPGFQYVEALVKAGITGGCGGGNFCPDNPVTRRQMAIFLAKALGLSYD